MPYRPRWNDYRTVLTDEFRTVISTVGFQAGALAHIVRDGAVAALCGVPLSQLGNYEDLDEPICQECIREHARLDARKTR